MTHGAFNVLVALKNDAETDEFIWILDADKIRWEKWTVEGGLVCDTLASKPIVKEGDWRGPLSQLQSGPLPAEFPHILDEYKALFASALSRAAQVYPKWEDDLLSPHAEVLGRLGRPSRYARDKTRTLLIDLNAALSRFASQAFSGASPIHSTECHFWTHSLLGTAVPLIALSRIRSFFLRTLGEYRIPDRVAAFGKIRNNLPALPSGCFSPALWHRDWLEEAGKHLKKQAPLLRQVVYLSGRDGFKTTESTLSAPLSTVTSCNSERWSLLTISHEVSHTILHSVLGSLLPARENTKRGRQAFEAAVDLYGGKRKPDSLLLLLRQYLLRAMDALDAVPEFSAPITGPQKALRSMDSDGLRDLIDRRLDEVEELLVHAFDFIYFYGSDIRRYVTAIWKSWQSIPQLETKLHEYLLRTLSTVATKHLGSDDACGRACIDVRSSLASLQAVLGARSYAAAALHILDQEWESKLEVELAARVLLSQLVPAFLQGVVSLSIVRRPSLHRHSTDIAFRDLSFVGGNIANPLEFIEQYTRAQGDPYRSFWMLYRLAFDTPDDPA